jgi:hypothetical protein
MDRAGANGLARALAVLVVAASCGACLAQQGDYLVEEDVLDRGARLAATVRADRVAVAATRVSDDTHVYLRMRSIDLLSARVSPEHVVRVHAARENRRLAPGIAFSVAGAATVGLLAGMFANLKGNDVFPYGLLAIALVTQAAAGELVAGLMFLVTGAAPAPEAPTKRGFDYVDPRPPPLYMPGTKTPFAQLAVTFRF